MLQHEIDVPLFKLKKRLSPNAAERIWQRSADSVDALIKLTAELDIHCSMQRKKALYLAGDEYGARALGRKSRRGRRSVFMLNFLMPIF